MYTVVVKVLFSDIVVVISTDFILGIISYRTLRSSYVSRGYWSGRSKVEVEHLSVGPLLSRS